MRRNSQRNEDLIAAVRSIGSLAQAARHFGISRERTRQIVSRHERATREVLGRGTRDVELYPLKQRVELTCSKCGASRGVLTRSGASWRNKLCQRCAGIIRTKVVSLEALEMIISRATNGESLYKIALEIGYVKHGTHCLKRLVYRHLHLNKRTHDIKLIWPKGVPVWLIKRLTIKKSNI